MYRIMVTALLLLGNHVFAQGVKMSSFSVAPAVDTGHMKLVVVYDAGGSYLNKQLSMGMFARYLSNSFTSSIAGGYGLTYTGMVFKVDSATVFPNVLATLSAGYGMLYAGRNFRVDTGTVFPRLASTFATGYGLSYSGRTYIADTGVLFNKVTSTLAVGYGVLYGGRTFRADTGTTFAKVASTLAAGYGIAYSSRTFKADTAALFPAVRSSINYTAVSTYNSQVGTSYTLQASDMGKVVSFSSSSAVTLTVPSGLGSGFYCTVQQNGTGLVTPSASGATLHTAHGYTKSNGQYTQFSIIFTPTTDTYVLQGDMQ